MENSTRLLAVALVALVTGGIDAGSSDEAMAVSAHRIENASSLLGATLGESDLSRLATDNLMNHDNLDSSGSHCHHNNTESGPSCKQSVSPKGLRLDGFTV